MLISCTVECQGGEFAPTKSYSPQANDIWSLGIILLNLITGRNPWKSASADDCTFQAYLRDPARFLPTVLPISQEVNSLLVRVLQVDWRHRTTLREMRQAVKEINNFYSPDVLFEDSMARCPWEAGVNVDDDDEEAQSASTGEPATETQPEAESHEQDFLVDEVNKQSQWSGQSDSEMHFTTHSPAGYSWEDSAYNEEYAAAADGHSTSPSSSLFSRRHVHDLRTASGPSTYSVVSSSPSIPSPPVTPGPDESLFSDAQRRPAHLTIDIDSLRNNYYNGSINMLSAATESVMQTAIESAQYSDFAPYSSFFYAESDKPSATAPTSDEMRMMITSTEYELDDDEMDTLSAYSYPNAEEYASTQEPMSARPESPVLGLELGFPSHEIAAINSQDEEAFNAEVANLSVDLPSHNPSYSFLAFSTPNPPTFNFPPLATPSHFSPIPTTLGSPFEYTPPASSSFASKAPSSRRSRSRSRKSRLLNPMRLAFTRRSRSPAPQSFQDEPSTAAFPTHWTLTPSNSSEQQSISCFTTPAASPKAIGSSSTSTAVEKQRDAPGIRRRTTRKRLRSPRDWFSPGKLLAAVIPSP